MIYYIHGTLYLVPHKKIKSVTNIRYDIVADVIELHQDDLMLQNIILMNVL
jgi:hypothetical protein